MSLLGQLEEAEFGDIAFCAFTFTYDGVTCGLIDESGPGRGNLAGLY